MAKSKLISLIVLALITCRSFAAGFADADTLTETQHGRFLLFPFFLKSPETNWGFGAATAFFFKPSKHDPDIRTSDINLVGLYTLRKQVVIVLGSTIFFPKEKSILRFQSSFSFFPDKCWGIGNETLLEAEEAYSVKQFYFNPQLLRRFFRNWYAGLTYDLQHVGSFKYQPNGVFDRQDIIGRYGGNASGFGFLLTWDTRNNAYSPSKGSFMEFSAKSFDDKFRSDFDFSSVSLDLRNFRTLSENQVLALQLIIKNNSGSVPIRNMAMLGGSEIMRGYYQGRFMHKDMISFQAEFRQYLFWRLGCAGFIGLGEVASRSKNFNWDGLHYSYGAGLRFMVSKSEKLNLRVDYGVGENSSGLYVILKEAF